MPSQTICALPLTLTPPILPENETAPSFLKVNFTVLFLSPSAPKQCSTTMFFLKTGCEAFVSDRFHRFCQAVQERLKG